MNDATAYWLPVCKLVMGLKCWVRMAWSEGEELVTDEWSQLLTVPVDGDLEVAGGNNLAVQVFHIDNPFAFDSGRERP